MNRDMIYYEDGEEVVVSVPHKFVVCPTCEGHGTHLHPAIGEHAYTSEEFYEAFSEEEDRAEYFRHGGRYDVCCQECKGEKVIAVPDEENLSPEQNRALEEYYQYQSEIAEMYREMRAEAKFGA